MAMLIIGCGNMGGAMLSGWLNAGAPADGFTVVDPYLSSAPAGVTLLSEPPAGARFDQVMIAIKPQELDATAPALAGVAEGAVLLSILAGVDLETLGRKFPGARAHVRVMPNLAAAIGKSAIALVESGLDAAGREALTGRMTALGVVEWLPDEALFDAVTALAGSGPGFVYRFIDALATGAVALGLDPAQAERLAVATVEGAAMLAAHSPHSPAELARRVASPGGTTQKGLDVLDEDRALERLIGATLRAARDRSAEMAEAARGR